MQEMWASVLLALAVGMAFTPGDAVAQGAPPARAFDPAQQLKELEEPVPKSAPRVEVVIPGSTGPVPADASGTTLVPRAFEITGVTALDPQQLQALYAPYLGRDTTIEELFGLAQAMTRLYREEGYVLCEVIVPPQRIDPEVGVVVLDAVEGYVAEIELSGDAVPAAVDGYLQKITRSRPLHVADLERYLLLANDVPGYSLRSVLAPADGIAGSSKLRVEARRTRFGGAFALSNSGTDSVGSYRGNALVSYNGLTGRGERTDFGYETANDIDELQQISLTHVELLGREGAQLQFSGSWSKVQPGADLRPYDIDGTTWQAELGVYQPLIRERSRNLTARAGVGTVSSTSSVIAATQFSDRYPYLFLNASYDFADSYQGLNIVSLDVRKGLESFDAHIDGRVGADPDFALAKLYVGRSQKLVHGISAYAAVFAQHAFGDLPASEEMSFGGRVLGRGYDSSEIAADHGVGAKLEVRYLTPGIYPIRQAEIYTFYDWAKVRERTAGQVLENGKRSESLSSAGLGAKLRFSPSISGYVEVAKPLTKGVAAEGGGRDARFNFELRTTF